MASPVWSLRVEGRRLSIVLQRAPLPGGAELAELVVELPHVSFPFDFRDGLERFRHHRGHADELALKLDSRLVLDWLNQASGGVIGGVAHDDQLVLSGRTEAGTRWTMRARLVPDRDEAPAGEPLLVLSLYGFRVYGPSTEPWPLMAERVLSLIPPELVVDRTLTTARLKVVRLALAHALASLGWKLPDTAGLAARGVELREGRFVARFSRPREGRGDAVDLDLEPLSDGEGWAGPSEVRSAFIKFVEDMEVKRHHGQVDRLLAEGKVREALAEVYRALDGPPRPGFLAERLIGITATQPILHDEGERVCRLLLDVAPGYEPALVGLAAIALMRNRPEEAAVQLERLAAEVNGPGDREDATAVDLTLASILADFAQDESRAALERVLQRSPDHEEALSELIALAEREGDVRHALPLYKRLLFAARSKARTREAGLRLARFALQRNEPEDARVLLKVVLESSPDDLEAQVALAEVETREGRAQEALRILEDALRKLPQSDTPRLVKLITLLGRLLLEVMADPAKARRVLWRAGDLSRMEAADAVELGRLALLAREPTLALRFTELVDEGDAWPEAQALRAEALVMRGESRTALQAVLAVLSREPDHERALGLLETVTPDASSREWLVHQLQESASHVASEEARARILHRVALLFQSMGLAYDALPPLEEAVFLAPDSDRFEERAATLMALQREFGLWSDYLRIGAQRLIKMRAAGLADEGAIARRVELLTALGRTALHEVEDLSAARTWLEEATRLSPRAIAAQELLTEALLAQLSQTHGAGRKATAMALAGVLTRLSALRPDVAGQDEARVLLAELQLDELGAAGQARATLGKLRAAEGERVARLLERVGLVARVEPRPEPRPPVRAPVSVAAWFDEALAAADAGRDAEALALLGQILAHDPGHQPTRELLALLGGATGKPPTESPRSAEATPEGRATRELRGEARAEHEAVPWEAVAREASAWEPVTQAGPWEHSPEGRGDPRTPALTHDWDSPLKDQPPGHEPPHSPGLTDWDSPLKDQPPGHENAQAPVLTDDWDSPLKDQPPGHSAPTRVRPAPQPSPEDDEDAEIPLSPRQLAGMSPEAGERVREKAAESDTIDELMGQAMGRYFEDDLDGALELLDQVLAIDPDVVAALELIQEILGARGDHRRRAEVLARLTVRVFDAATVATYLRSLGECHELLGEHDLARAAFIRYLRSRPLDEPLFGMVARALDEEATPEARAALADLYEARADALEDLDDPRGRATALTGAARVHFAARDLAAAEHAAERAVALAPDSPEALELAVRIALAQGQLERARAAAKQLVPLMLPGPEREWLDALAT